MGVKGGKRSFAAGAKFDRRSAKADLCISNLR